MKKKMKSTAMVLLASATLILGACASTKDDTIDFILDWTPNTNHTGLYVALDKGYFEEEGVKVDIKLPSEDSSSDLVINGKAPFVVYFQDFMAKKLEKGAGITAVAALVEHNTSGIISAGEANIKSPKDLVGKKYGTWNDPIELAMLETLVSEEGGDFATVEKVPNTDANSITPIANKMFDAAWIYYGWDGIMAEQEGMKTNYFYLRDFAPEFDYYSPVIIANNDYLKEHPDQAKKVLKAIKKGYQYAIENPKESAEILIKHAPALENQKEFVLASQEYLSKHYASNPEKWGEFDADRWNAFYAWAYKKGILESDLKNQGFSNDYLSQ
ncbi:nitrate/sulfonate/bicarbonate ABC transporter periplasmic protein [Streptococcus varani]|uniref:Nitrate/sulfonate/bicarbonate ABC transporter periplasmic protein n=1 Tax=Streptococcus varani TaxID=1608583 RepID=A0A0E4H3J7_9STRE|nr:nitrate/sulfonate/bicarbonate ABC transporter periplasmic protein [Streptococcus varani]